MHVPIQGVNKLLEVELKWLLNVRVSITVVCTMQIMHLYPLNLVESAELENTLILCELHDIRLQYHDQPPVFYER